LVTHLLEFAGLAVAEPEPMPFLLTASDCRRLPGTASASSSLNREVAAAAARPVVLPRGGRLNSLLCSPAGALG
jgi:hypothetical protein